MHSSSAPVASSSSQCGRRQLGDIEAMAWDTAVAKKKKKAHREISACWQQCLGEKNTKEEGKLMQEMLMVSREGEMETEYKQGEGMSD